MFREFWKTVPGGLARGLLLAGWMVGFTSEGMGADWYVNDASLTSDVFTSATGNDANPGTAGAPFLTITKAMSVAAAGDTIKVDAGLYGETVVISADNISLVGVDSLLTVVDPPDVGAPQAITALNKSGLRISDLAVQGVLDGAGIFFEGVMSSVISSVRASSRLPGSSVSGGFGIILLTSDSNTLVNNIAETNRVGIDVNRSNNNQLTGNTVSMTSLDGFSLSQSSNNRLEFNTSLNAKGSGFHIAVSNSSNNVLSSNTSKGGNDYAFYVDSTDSNLLTNNTAVDNNGGGFHVGGSNNIVVDNISMNNGVVDEAAGYAVGGFSDSNIIRNNLSRNNWIGMAFGDNMNNVFSQNTVESSVTFELQIVGQEQAGSVGANNSFMKNNILPAAGGMGVFVRSAIGDVFVPDTFDLSRNWWGTTDSNVIRNMIQLVTGVEVVKYIPFRLGEVDTRPNADTIAPTAPDSVTVDTSIPGQITVRWNTVNANEEGVAWSNDLGGYNLYRDTESDPDRRTFLATVSASTTSFVDTTVSPGVTYFYKVTSFDTHSPQNESFYEADTISAPVGGNTPVGTNVTVNFPSEDVSITFTTVTAAGATTVTRSDTGPSFPGFQVADCNPFPYFTISTTATFDSARVKVTYDPSCFMAPPPVVQQEQALELYHFDGVPPDPETVTESRNLGQNTITSIPLSSFSPFVVAAPVLNAHVRIEPVTIGARSAESNGVVSVFVEAVDQAPVSDILVESVRLLGAAPVHSEFAGGGKKGPRLLLQMRRKDLDLSQVPVNTLWPVTVSGFLNDGRQFAGQAAIFVREK